MPPRGSFLVLLGLLAGPAVAFAQTAPAPPPDPSGSWRSVVGDLSLMLAGDALSFSYTAVFGPAAHICDGSGVAGLDGDGRWVWLDDAGAVEFVVVGDGLRMRQTDGVASFCGAGWGGDVFPGPGHRPPAECTVHAARSRFHVVDHLEPARRRGHVVRSDRVEVAPVHNLDLEGFVLARSVGTGSVTAGLLRRDDLTCPEGAGVE